MGPSKGRTYRPWGTHFPRSPALPYYKAASQLIRTPSPGMTGSVSLLPPPQSPAMASALGREGEQLEVFPKHADSDSPAAFHCACSPRDTRHREWRAHRTCFLGKDLLVEVV